MLGYTNLMFLLPLTMLIEQELDDMCYEAGVLLEYLPPYSPDFNPIELAFGKLKVGMIPCGREARGANSSPWRYLRTVHAELEAGGDIQRGIAYWTCLRYKWGRI